MEVKAEPSNGPPMVKSENPNPQGPKGNFKQGGPNMQKKKNFQNRGGKMGNNQQGGNNRGPMKNEVSLEIRRNEIPSRVPSPSSFLVLRRATLCCCNLCLPTLDLFIV